MTLVFLVALVPTTSFPLVSHFLSLLVSFSCVLVALRVVGE